METKKYVVYVKETVTKKYFVEAENVDARRDAAFCR